MKSTALVLLTTGIVLGASMVQTDWSGGPSGEVTTTEWGCEFGSCFGMGWKTQGVLTLGTALDWAKVSNGGSLLLRACNANEDSFTDLISHIGYGYMYLYPSDGDPYLWEPQTIGSADSILTIFAGDLNGDGLDDAIGGATSLYWWENPNDPNQAWEKRSIENVNVVSGAVVDYDEDGDNDIICSHNTWSPTTANLTLFRNLGSGLVWETTLLYNKEQTPTGSEFTVAEITGDGYLTAALLLCQFPAPMIYILREGPSGWYEYKTVSQPYSDIERLFPSFADLDNDGIADLVAGGKSFDYGRIRWYKGPEFYPYYNLETNDNVYGMAVIDFDSDGDMDIIYRGENSVGMFENTRSPQERFVQRVLMEYPFSNGLDSESAGGLVAPGDFDGDGVEDFVCDFNDLYWWRLGEDFCSSGWLNSDILYVYDASWGELSWDASVPAETQLCFQVRGSDDPGNLGEWSGLCFAPVDLSSYLADGESYLQYRVTMLSDNPSVTPQLNSVTVTYDPLGIEESPQLRLSVSPSPASTTANVRLSLPEPADCTVSVYGLDGRVVERLHSGSLPAGESVLVWNASSVPSGVYFVRVTGSGLNSTERLVVAK